MQGGGLQGTGLLLSCLGSAWCGVHTCHTVGVPHIWSRGPCELGADETEVGTVDTWDHCWRVGCWD